MRNSTCYLASGVIALNGLIVGGASAEVYFSDNFELQPITSQTPPGQALQPPPVGIEYRYAGTTQIEAVNVVQSPFPTIGTKSLEAVREPSRQAHVIGVSNAGALIDGNTLEVKWSHQLAGGTGHRFNAPMQNSFGYSNGGIGNLAQVQITDSSGHAGEYHYSDAFLGLRSTGVQPTLNGWDHLRMVLTLDQYDSVYMTGTYDLFVRLNDSSTEIQLADNAVLSYAQMATEDDAENELTSAWFRVQKGPFTSHSYYDNISVADFGEALLGDFNLDSIVNAADIDMLTAHISSGGTNSLYDVNGDTFVTTADLDYQVESILATNFGDTDLDGDVDLSDLSNLAANYGQTPRGWTQGNFDIDTDVDLNDLSNLAAHYGMGEAQAFADFQAIAVPEPTSLAVLGLGVHAMLGRRRRC